MPTLDQLTLESIQKAIQAPILAVDRLQGDASSRRYFRIQTQEKTLIWMDTRACPEVKKPFVAVSELLSHHGIPCPHIHCMTQTGLLIDDLGQNTLEDQIRPGDFSAYEAITPIYHQLTKIPSGLPKIAVFNPQMILNELQLFTDWYMPLECQKALSTHQTHILQGLFDKLVLHFSEQPQCFVHRDFHCRNIMIHQSSPYLIDYQDAVIGPITYDATSLLKDCYLNIPREQALYYLKQYYEILALQCSWDQWIEWFDLTGLQRHLKVLGIFTRLKHRDQKPHYMNSVPHIINMIDAVIEDHPQFKPLQALIKKKEYH